MHIYQGKQHFKFEAPRKKTEMLHSSRKIDHLSIELPEKMLRACDLKLKMLGALVLKRKTLGA